MYRLANGSGVIRLSDNAFIPENLNNKDWLEYQEWIALGNIPQSALQPTPEQIASDAEKTQAPITAREYFASKPAALTFIRSTPTEQDTQIEAMTLAQLKTVVKYLAVACSALIKQQYL